MTEYKYVYACRFELFINMNDWINLQVESDKGLHAFKDGFWINGNYEFTTSSDCVYWIPPSRISGIWKKPVSIVQEKSHV